MIAYNEHDFVPADFENNEQMWQTIFQYVRSISNSYDILIQNDGEGVIMISSVPSDHSYGDNLFMCVAPEEYEDVMANRTQEGEEYGI